MRKSTNSSFNIKSTSCKGYYFVGDKMETALHLFQLRWGNPPTHPHHRGGVGEPNPIIGVGWGNPTPSSGWGGGTQGEPTPIIGLDIIFVGDKMETAQRLFQIRWGNPPPSYWGTYPHHRDEWGNPPPSSGRVGWGDDPPPSSGRAGWGNPPP